MSDRVSLSLVQSLIDTQKDLIVLFHDNEIILSNHAFNHFFAVSSCEQYKKDFGAFVNNFVPHPSYFNKDKMQEGENWMDAILKMPERDRIVSMMTPSFEPHAFSVGISKVEEDVIVTLNDITQSLIKRIMIENHANMDVQSGAYSKEYFLHVAQSYEDALAFNEKILGAILIDADKKDGGALHNDEKSLSTLVSHFKGSIRQDDMLIRWSGSSFLLIFLVDSEVNAQSMLRKLQDIVNHENIEHIACHLNLKVQEKGEHIAALIRRLEN
jgi:GGDEF domain-containing protein